jgi:hypothetical protein
VLLLPYYLIWRKKYDSCSTTGEEMELYEQILPAGKPFVYDTNALVFPLDRI